MKITDAKIDPATFGNKMWLVDVKPAYAYENNHRTDTVIGYRYIVALPERGLDKVSIASTVPSVWTRPTVSWK